MSSITLGCLSGSPEGQQGVPGAELGVKMTSVAYPYGNHNPLIEDLLLAGGSTPKAGITVNGAKVSH